MNYQQHKREWINCKRCHLFRQRNKVVLLRGKIPCDILFVGEAPGISEDIIGMPFIGPSGKLLDQIIEEAKTVYLEKPDLRVAFTSLVACIPKDKNGDKIHEPDIKCIKRCSKRLRSVIKLTKPSAIISVGQLAKKHIPSDIETQFANIIHPAAILRLDVSQQSLAIHRCIVEIQEVVKNF